MPLLNRQRIAAEYKAHMLANKASWARSEAARMSLSRRQNAQYNPNVLAGRQVYEIELACIELGIPITDIENCPDEDHKFYMDCRLYFDDPTFVAGVCLGEWTPYILVRWDSDGFYHGQPASIGYLKKNGAKL